MACTIEWCEPDKPPRCFKFVLPKPTPVGKLVKKCAKAAGATHVNVQVRPRGGGNALGAADLVPSDAVVFYTAVPEAAPAAALSTSATLSTSAAPAAALSTSAAPAPAPPPKAHVARYASWLRGPAAPRVASSDEAAVVAALRKRQPIVVEDSSLTKSLRHWTFQYLADHSDGDVPRFHTHFAPKRRRVFPRKYGKKLMPGEAAAEEGGIVATTFRDFHELIEGARRNPAEPLAYYCQQTVLSYGDRDPDGRSPPPAGAAPMSGDHAFLKDLYEADWAWLDRVTACLGPFFMTSLWCGDGASATPMHYDCKDNWLCQVAGRKHVLLFPPARSFDVYPYPLDHPMTEFTMVDLEKPDLRRWPAFEQLRRGGVWATLEPGDALFIPRFTWHYVEQCEPDADNISVNFWFGGYCDNMEDLQDLHGVARGDAARGRCDLATRRILAHRLTEWIAKASLAPVDIEPHEFLTTWAARGARVFEVPLYRNLRQFAADLVARMAPIVDGEANFFDLLRDMCKDGRLHPGPPAFTVVASGEENRNTPRDELPAKLRGLLRADAARSDSEDDFAGLDG